MRVMIVDDNAGMREMIRSAVCSDEDAVLECSDGAEAVDSYPDFRPDYVLMDIEMKTMDGFSATEKIYEHDRSAKVIFVTDHNTSAFRLKAHSLHARGFISKENLSELNQLLHQ